MHDIVEQSRVLIFLTSTA